MNIRLVMYLLGKLSIACAVAMVVPMITALLLGEYMFLGFIFSFMICAFIGGALIGNGEKNKRAHLNLREALATVGCGWLLVVVLLTPRMESLRQKVGGGDEVWLGLITCSASIGLFGYMASQYYNKIVVDPAQAWSCIAGSIVMVACVKLSKKMPWLKEYGLGIAIVLGIVVGALVK